MLKIDKTKPVLVTGATGYVAGRLVERLLLEGLTVHAAVRDPDDKIKTASLREVADKLPGKLIFFKADLLAPDSYLEAMENCNIVFHTASPFITRVKNPQRDLVEPALLGTRNVLETANKVISVERVVLTSSVAAIYGDNLDIQKIKNQILTENNWNTTSSLNHNPYYYSKTVAEREAWKIQNLQSRWDLVVINPSLVIGPGISPKGTSESFNIMKQLGDGSMAFGVPDFSIGVVDVRDVAEAHFKAAFLSETKGRHIISAENITLPEITQIIREKYGNTYPIPKRILPKLLVWLLAPFSGLSRKFVSNNIGYPFRADNSKSKNMLGMKYRPAKDSVIEFFEQLASSGQLKKN